MGVSALDPAMIAAQVAAVAARHPEVAAAWLFGSVARGRPTAESDLDVGFVYRDRGSRAHDALATTLAIELAQATGFAEIDVVDLEAQGPIFAHRVLCDGLRAYEGDRSRRVDFESDTIVRALDFMPTHVLATRGKRAAMRRWLEERYGLG
jgi:predicted nucleotidyltransferase